MKPSTAIKKSAEYVRIAPFGDQWHLIYFPLPWDKHRWTTESNAMPWAQARQHHAESRARIALCLMGASNSADGRLVENGEAAMLAVMDAAERVGETSIPGLVESALEWLAAGNYDGPYGEHVEKFNGEE